MPPAIRKDIQHQRHHTLSTRKSPDQTLDHIQWVVSLVIADHCIHKEVTMNIVVNEQLSHKYCLRQCKTTIQNKQMQEQNFISV